MPRVLTVVDRVVKSLELLSGEPLLKDTQRVYEICDGCRRCFNLCPSFNTLLDRLDQSESDVTKLSLADHRRVADECYYCKLCYNHCPYTPPHQYQIDFPRLMVAWKKELATTRGVRWRDRLLIQTDLIGNLGSRLAPLVNRMLRTGWLRAMIERIAGVHRRRDVLPFSRETFATWWSHRPQVTRSTAPTAKVALFAGCLVNYQATDIGKATVQVLEKNGADVVVPSQRCCGMPSFDLGDLDAIRAAAEANLAALHPLVEQGYDVVVPVASCSLMLKREYPAIVSDQRVAAVAERTFDVCEYLMRLKREGRLSTDFVRRPGRIAYQIPCHLRDQNIGFKSKELMELTGAQVDVIERCSGHDGTWSAKTEFFDLSMGIARKAAREIQQTAPAVVASDCPLAGLQLDQAGASTDTAVGRTLHPIQIVRDAYGLSS